MLPVRLVMQLIQSQCNAIAKVRNANVAQNCIIASTQAVNEWCCVGDIVILIQGGGTPPLQGPKFFLEPWNWNIFAR
jgi:hypothetical protein